MIWNVGSIVLEMILNWDLSKTRNNFVWQFSEAATIFNANKVLDIIGWKFYQVLEANNVVNNIISSYFSDINVKYLHKCSIYQSSKQ